MRLMGSIIMVLVTMVLLTVAGCSTMTQDDINSAIQAAGALSVGAYNTQGDKLPPQQKQAAKAAMTVLASVGAITNGGNVGDVRSLADAALAKQIKDPAQLALAQQALATFFGAAQPFMDKAMTQYGSNGAAQAFIAFCRGVASVPIN